LSYIKEYRMSGTELKDIRERLGYTQAELAKEVGVKTDTVSKWEQGRRNIPAPVEKLLKLLRRGKQ
jgi:DNA-binding transcriptional regulator YiaG